MTRVLGLRFVASVLLCLGIASAAEPAKVWAAKCATCHGADGKGQTPMGKTMKAGDFTTSEWQKRKDGEIRKGFEDGKPPRMQAFKAKLSAEESDGLVKHIRAFGKPAPPAK